MMNPWKKVFVCIAEVQIKIKEAIQVNVAGIAKIKNLLSLIQKDLEDGMNDTKEFRDRLNRALELDPHNKKLYNMQKMLINLI